MRRETTGVENASVFRFLPTNHRISDVKLCAEMSQKRSVIHYIRQWRTPTRALHLNRDNDDKETTTKKNKLFGFLYEFTLGMSALFEFTLRQAIRQWKDDSSQNTITHVQRLKLSAILYLALVFFFVFFSLSISLIVALTASCRLERWRESLEGMFWAESLGSPVTVANARSCTSVWEQCGTYGTFSSVLYWTLIQSTR